MFLLYRIEANRLSGKLLIQQHILSMYLDYIFIQKKMLEKISILDFQKVWSVRLIQPLALRYGQLRYIGRTEHNATLMVLLVVLNRHSES